MLESFGTWIINPCDNLDEPYLIRGDNYFIGYCPDKTFRYEVIDSTTSILNIKTVLLQNVAPEQNYYLNTHAVWNFQLRFIGEEYFEVRDYAKTIYNSFYNIKGALVPDVEDENYEYLIAGIQADPPFFVARDEKANFVFVINITFLAHRRLISVNPWPEGYIPIYTIEEIQLIGNNIGYPSNGNYWLMNDIDASDTYNWNNGDGFEPIGRLGLEFSGIFQGNGYIVYNIYINRPTYLPCALFRICLGATIENIQVNGYVIGDEAVALLIGVAAGRTRVLNCASMGEVYGNTAVGGLVGSIPNDFANAFVCNSWSGADIECYVNNGGGLIGFCAGEVENSFSYGGVAGSGTNLGGLVGSTGSYYVDTNNYWDTDTSYQNNSDMGTGKTTYELSFQNTFVDWDFTNIWSLHPLYSYPRLTGIGTHPTFYPITKGSELNKLNAFQSLGDQIFWGVNKNYVLRNDVDLSDIDDFTPIGFVSDTLGPEIVTESYKYIFDGSGYKVDNLSFDRQTFQTGLGVGLFGVLYDGKVFDLAVENINIIGLAGVGGLVGGVIGETYVSNCYTTGSVSSLSSGTVGGLIGSNPSGGELAQTSNSYSECIVSANEDCGGLIGYSVGYTLNCYSIGLIEDLSGSDLNINGFIGSVDSGSVQSNCYWDTQTSGRLTSAGDEIGLTTIEMKQENSFNNWDFTYSWSITENETYPKLRVFE